MPERNLQVLFASRPAAAVGAEHFALVEGPVPRPGEGEVLIRNVYLSLDPYMRGRMRGTSSYVTGFALGEPLQGGVVGEVVESRNPAFEVGEIVVGMLRWEEYSLSDGAGLRKVDPAAAPVSTALGVLGMPGMTAYVGLLDIGRPNEGETVMVSAAAGAVGSAAGQVARIKGCRVAGCAGSDAKVAYLLDELGFDAAFNYRTAESLGAALDQACPDGIDIYFENVGGPLLDAVLPRMRVGGRVVLCGMISQYELERPDPIRNLIAAVPNRLRLEGFIVSDHGDRLPAFLADMGAWVRSGRVKYRESIARGLENAPAAFVGLMRGDNLGKQLVQIGEVPR